MKAKSYICLFILFCIISLTNCGDDDKDIYIVHMLGEWDFADARLEIDTNSPEANTLVKEYVDSLKATESGAIILFEKHSGSYYKYTYFTDESKETSRSGTYVLYEEKLSISGIPGICDIEMANNRNTLQIIYNIKENLSKDALDELYRNAGILNPERIEAKSIVITKIFNRRIAKE